MNLRAANEALSFSILQIVASVESEAAGPSYSVTRLASTLAARGLQSGLFSVGNPSMALRDGVECRVFKRDFGSVPVFSNLYASRDLRAAIDRFAVGGGILHTHGLWLMPNVYPSWSAGLHSRPLLLSPRGMLGSPALEFSRRKKMMFWRIAQRSAVEVVSCFHATSVQEYDDIRRLGFKAPVAVVPNGIDVPALNQSIIADRPRSQEQMDTVLYLGRIHAKKGIDRLLAAWAQVERQNPHWRLRVVGPLEGSYPAELKAMSARLGLERASFDDALYGEKKAMAYRSASLFVLPTLDENFGMVVAEALAHGVPVISTKGAPWAGLDIEGCGWWIDHGTEPLVRALNDAMSMPRKVRLAMGARGRTWMERDYSWDGVGAEMENVYRWCDGRADRPKSVIVD
ncbi:glycosyltransferase [Mesorhizobium sp. M0563]|uniref:glycosyltransferase n=1 Tax=unclassified Mesorhizobium TaxID=325217 RepID=UPI0033378090